MPPTGTRPGHAPARRPAPRVAILTTRWARRERGRLGFTDVAALHRAFGLHRLHDDGGRQGTLSRAYERAGAQAQREFWGPEHPEASMLAQMALA